MIKGHLVDIKHSVYSEDVHVCTFFLHRKALFAASTCRFV